jgi:methylmalonyl-CoA/ethylmalonyl-CoA epimerase
VSAIGQIALHVTDADRAEAFYRETLGLTRLYRFGQLVFFDCGGVRLMLDGGHAATLSSFTCCVYFRVENIAARVSEMKVMGASFDDEPHLIARMPDHELWMTFFKDPDGNQLALMEERR